MLIILKGIVAGMINGAIIAALGYARLAGKEDFDEKKFLQTAIIGAVVGGVGADAGWTYSQAYEWASTMGLITIIEYIKKAVWRRLKK